MSRLSTRYMFISQTYTERFHNEGVVTIYFDDKVPLWQRICNALKFAKKVLFDRSVTMYGLRPMYSYGRPFAKGHYTIG